MTDREGYAFSCQHVARLTADGKLPAIPARIDCRARLLARLRALRGTCHAGVQEVALVRVDVLDELIGLAEDWCEKRGIEWQRPEQEGAYK